MLTARGTRKGLVIVLGGFFIMSIAGCALFGGSLKYSVEIKNTGKEKINISSFKLYKSENSNLVVTGMFGPGVRKSSGPFFKKPNSQIKITWTVSRTKKSSEKTIDINLPTLFPNKEYGADIIIHLNSDKNKLIVAYRVFDPKKQDFIVVDSEGKLFDIEKANK